MNIIPEKKYGKSGCVNNMDILIKLKINHEIENKKNFVNIIFDNSISSIGECFLNMKNGIKKFISLIPSNFNISIYTNSKNIYNGKNIILEIYNALSKVKCEGFNNYQKYIDLELENCFLFTDEDMDDIENLNVININNCLTFDYLYNKYHETVNNMGTCELKFFSLNNNFIKKYYDNDMFKPIIIKNFIKNKEYNFLINMDILSINSKPQNILEVNLFINDKLIENEKLEMIFVKDYNFKNTQVIVQKILIEGKTLENEIKRLYKLNNLPQIKIILYKLKEIYNFKGDEYLKLRFEKVVNSIKYINEEINSENLKSLELNNDMKYTHFDLDK
jgi:hypothetical protein